MIPLRDIQPRLSRPWLTWIIIAINVGIFAFQLILPPDLQPLFLRRWGLIPAYLLQQSDPGPWITPITSMFLHGGLLHLLGNLWFLQVFGDNVEDALGHVRFVAFYLACGLAAAAAQVAVDPEATVPMVGASGAIAGVLGAYLTLFPRARVLTLTPIFLLIEIPAWVFLMLWFVLQAVQGLTRAPGESAVAWWAHIGGFCAGLVLVRVMVSRERLEARAELLRPEPSRQDD